MKYFLLCASVTLCFFTACKKQNTKAEFNVLKTSFYLTESVSFNNQSSNGKSYTWDFGDGQTSTEASPSHAYTTAGVYRVKLTAGKSTFTKAIKVNDGTASYEVSNQTTVPLPFLSFRFGLNNEPVDFKDHGTLAVNGKSDTVYTSYPLIYVGGYIGTAAFIVQRPYTISKFTHNQLAIFNSTQVVMGINTQAGINNLKKPGVKTYTIQSQAGVIQ